MASRLNPYISFDGDARQAMEFYQGVFGGDLDLNTFGQFNPDQTGEMADRIMHG
ncbi:VOC family protein, partial [Kitasatospora sp. NPDC007106]